jgi:hypothetical protein
MVQLYGVDGPRGQHGSLAAPRRCCPTLAAGLHALRRHPREPGADKVRPSSRWRRRWRAAGIRALACSLGLEFRAALNLGEIHPRLLFPPAGSVFSLPSGKTITRSGSRPAASTAPADDGAGNNMAATRWATAAARRSWAPSSRGSRSALGRLVLRARGIAGTAAAGGPASMAGATSARPISIARHDAGHTNSAATERQAAVRRKSAFVFEIERALP